MAVDYRNFFRDVKRANRPVAEKSPSGTIGGMETWDQDAFLRRIEARLAQLGDTEKGLLRDAGGSGDEIRKSRDAKRGPRIDTVVTIAKALHWTVQQALGLQDPTLFFDQDREIDPDKLRRALDIANRAVGEYPATNRLATVADFASLVYSVLSEREQRGLPLDDESVQMTLESILRRHFPRRQ